MSFTFDEITKFKIGEVYWENLQGGCYQFEVISQVIVKEIIGEGAKILGFKAVCVKSSENINFLFTNQYMRYGPKISNTQEYFSSKELGSQ